MAIIIENNVFHLQNDKISYIMEIVDNKYLVHRYFGKKIKKYNGSGKIKYFKRGHNTTHNISEENVSFDDYPFEYPIRGKGDYRIDAFSIQNNDNINHTELYFKEAKILDKKPIINGLPSLYSKDNDTETLLIICEDDVIKIRIYMYYTIFKNNGIITKHQKIENYGKNSLFITKAKSSSLELPAKEYKFLSLYGTHIKEANIEKFPLHHGIQKIESVRGVSSHQYQPFFALISPETNEFYGEVYAFQLIYSGNFVAEVEKDQFNNIRAQIGINPDTFKWKLEKDEIFETPEAILNYSNEGLNGMSRNFHKLYKNNLIPEKEKSKERPILLNSWEAMYYETTEKKVKEQIELAKEIGIELFVLDDGWFRKENSSKNSMGDWEVNQKKLPCGIKGISDFVHKKGMKFGLWFEPEAVSEDSQLFKKHKDWVLHVPNYSMTKGRNEYLLDLSNEKVIDYILHVFDRYLSNNDIDYIKWDMNRPLTEVNSTTLEKDRKNEVYHRYILGLYKILKTVMKKYPNVLIEGCSSGGGRFDLGILAYVAQNWTSDNTDAFDRAIIQNNFSLLYPPITMGAHVSITPNHQTGREISLETRYNVAELFNLGYEFDFSKLDDSTKKQIVKQIIRRKKYRKFIENSEFYRLETPNDNYIMWAIMNPDKTECIVTLIQKYFNPITSHGKFVLKILEDNYIYEEINTKKIFGGDELNNIGFTIPLIKKDYKTFVYHFKKLK